jgi:hypothetical protein
MNNDHNSIITRLITEARIAVAQEDSHKRSIRAKQALAARREREGRA